VNLFDVYKDLVPIVHAPERSKLVIRPNNGKFKMVCHPPRGHADAQVSAKT
jgi:hypothetical protein